MTGCMGTAPRASRERFSDDGEALMDALRRQRVAHRTLVTVEVYIGKIERRNRENIATLRAALDGHHRFLQVGAKECGICKRVARAALAAAKETP